jgi:hypothetical protein
MEMSAKDISLLIGVSERAVQKRLKDKYDLVLRRISNGGRPQLLFDVQRVLALYGMMYEKGEAVPLKPILAVDKNGNEIEKMKVRKSRNDRGELRKPPCELTEKAIKMFIDRALEIYLESALRDNIQRSVYRAVQELTGMSERDDDFQKIARYIYKNKVMRHDEYFIGAKWHPIDWGVLWDNERKKNKTNELMPTSSWDFYELFENSGIIKNGSGAGAFWIMDGTQYDCWVKLPNEKNPVLIKFFAIIDGVTKFPLWVRPLVKGESIQEAIEAVKDCVMIYGAPRYGFVLDNSSTFKAPKFKGFLKTICKEPLEEKARKLVKAIFPNSEFPIYYPLQRIPRYPIKSLIERSFGELNLYPALYEPMTYKGGTSGRELSYELGSTPTRALKLAPQFEESWIKFACWVWNDYANKADKKIHSRFVAKGLKSAWSIADAFEYYGGDSLAALNMLGLDITHTERYLNPDKNNYALLPADFSDNPLTIYYESDKVGYHKLEEFGHILIRRENVDYNFHCKDLNASFLNYQIAYVIRIENEKPVAYFYLEYDAKKYHPLTPNKHDVYFIGKGYDATHRTLEGIQKLNYLRADNQRHQEEYLNNAVPDYRNRDGRDLENKKIEDYISPKLTNDNQIDDIFNF